MYDIDRAQHEPPHEEEIEAYVAFSSAFMEQADLDGNLFDVITNWTPERIMAYQKAFFMLNVVTNPQYFGFED